MRPLFRPDGCAINEAGISSAGNPMSQVFDGMSQQQQMGARPMGPMGPRGSMMGPMQRGGGMEDVWAEAGPSMMGPMMGDAMPGQLRHHMQGPGPEAMMQPGFYNAGPMDAGPSGANWAQEMAMQPGPGMHAPNVWAQEMAMQAGPAHAGPISPEMAMASQMPMQAGPFAPGMRVPMMRPMGPMGPMGPMMRPPMDGAMAPLEQAPVEQTKVEEAKVEEVEDMTQPAQMVEMLRNSGNPKFANSQFVDFIDKVTKGELKFTEETVVDRNGEQVDWDDLYNTDPMPASASSSTMEKAWNSSDPQMQEAWQAERREFEQLMEKAMHDTEISAEERTQLQQAWAQAGTDQAWLGDQDQMSMEQMFNQAGAAAPEYAFQKENSYLGHEDPLAEGLRLLREGRDREAMLCFEAEVQRNPESSEGWRQLGQLYAEFDQDVEAIQCLKKGHAADPYNLDSLLALGVSCTNELDQIPALRYLRLWIENHEEHGVLVQGLQKPPDFEFTAWKQQVTDLFNKAAEVNPMDYDVFVALGVMENINRNYDGAIRALATACRLRPMDHAAWNKLGATLANSGKSEQAIIAYHQGLQLKPNYARSWSNLAIAHANLGQHTDAARFYLSSLVLNPDASHIWNFLHSTVLNIGNMTGAFEAIDKRDLGACTRMIDGVLDPQALPPRVEQLSQPVDAILGSMNL